MADPERTLEVLAGLRAIGVATALDDFGAGHVSLGHLKQLDLDELKIDRSFVMRLRRRRARRRDRAHDGRPRPPARDARRGRGRRERRGVGHARGLQLRRGPGLLPGPPDDRHGARRAGCANAPPPARSVRLRRVRTGLNGLEIRSYGGRVAATIAALVLLGELVGVDDARSASAGRGRCCRSARSRSWSPPPALVRWRALGAPLVLGGAVALAAALPGGEVIAVNAAVCVILLGAALLVPATGARAWPTLRAARRADRGPRAARATSSTCPSCSAGCDRRR